MNVPCIVDQDHQRWAIVVDHFSKLKPNLVDGEHSTYGWKWSDTSGDTREITMISGKKEKNIFVENLEKESKKLNGFQKLGTRVDDPEPSVQSKPE